MLFFGGSGHLRSSYRPGTDQLDFADIKSVMKDAGPAWMSVGKAGGQSRAAEAAKAAMASPLLDVSIGGATGVLFNITGGPSLTCLSVMRLLK